MFPGPWVTWHAAQPPARLFTGAGLHDIWGIASATTGAAFSLLILAG
jgi:hypothetical protein